MIFDKLTVKILTQINMKKYLLSLVILLFAVSGFSQAPLPAFTFTDTDSKTLSPAELEQGKPIIVFYFDPDCDHCQQQATWVKESMDLFKGVQMIWVSWGDAEMVKKFKSDYFGEFPDQQIHFANDTEYNIDNWFGYSEVPNIYVYNSSWTLTQKFTKETAAKDIASWINK